MATIRARQRADGCVGYTAYIRIHRDRQVSVRRRRPTRQELIKLHEYFQRRGLRSSIPMVDIMWFAIGSARRETEICLLRWTDNDAVARTGMVRDAKHLTSEEGNHERFKYTPEG